MIPHHCIIPHRPPDSYGDCLRAAVASMFGVENVADVPHFLHDGDDDQCMIRFREYLWSRGFRPFMMAAHGSLEDIFTMMREANTDIEYLLCCACGDADHVVLCKNDRIIHDPAWYKSAITGPPTIAGGAWVIIVMVGEP
jgi:hypothetical protein